MRHTLQNDAPAGGFADCYLLGNPNPWAPPFTAARALSVSTSTSTRSGPGDPPPGVWCDPGDVAPLRAAVAAGDHRRADELARALQSDRWVQAFQPLGWIEWEHDRAPSGKTSAAYRRSLDMSAAVAVTDAGTGVRLETFVSAVDDVLVARADGAPTFAPLLRSPHPVRTTSSTQSGVTWVTMSGRAPANVLPHYVPHDTPVVYADDAPDEDGLVEAGMGFALVVAWVPNERGGRLIAVAESGFRTRSPRAFPDGHPSGGTGCSRAWCSTPWRRVR